MKTFLVIPTFSFTVEADNEKEASAIAYEQLKQMSEIVDFDFDFTIEEAE